MIGSLWEFLCFQLSKQLGFGETRAAELTGMMIGNSEKTVREWRKDFLFFFENDRDPRGQARLTIWCNVVRRRPE